MLEGFAEKLMKMPRIYLYLMAIYAALLLINIIYFYIPSLVFGLYQDAALLGFTLYSFVPLLIFAAELEGRIDDEHFTFVRNLNYLLIIFFLLITTILILPVLAI